MPGYFLRLLSRSRGSADVARPVIAPLFSPPAPALPDVEGIAGDDSLPVKDGMTLKDIVGTPHGDVEHEAERPMARGAARRSVKSAYARSSPYVPLLSDKIKTQNVEGGAGRGHEEALVNESQSPDIHAKAGRQKAAGKGYAGPPAAGRTPPPLTHEDTPQQPEMAAGADIVAVKSPDRVRGITATPVRAAADDAASPTHEEIRQPEMAAGVDSVAVKGAGRAPDTTASPVRPAVDDVASPTHEPNRGLTLEKQTENTPSGGHGIDKADATGEEEPGHMSGPRTIDVKQAPQASEADATIKPDGMYKMQFHKKPHVDEDDTSPQVRVVIGRVEVKAVIPAEPKPAKPGKKAEPKMTLDGYLRSRGGGQ